MENRFGLATCFYPGSSPQLWLGAAEAGFTDGEIDVDSRLSPQEICLASQKIYDDLRQGGLDPTSFHLPFGTQWDISSEDRALREKVFLQLMELVRWMGEHRIPIAILHPSYEPIPDAARPARLRWAAESIRRLGEAAGEYGVRLAVEDLPRTCLGNCADELGLLTGEGRYAGICFDVNHLLKESHREFVEKVGRYVITTHLSDYDRTDEKHWMPGDGCIDWQELAALLEGVGYRGRYLFELGENASPSLGRPFTPKELKERFQRLTCGGA